MTRTLIAFVSLSLLSPLALGCGKGGDSCDSLQQAVAKGSGQAADKVGPWLDKELTGPSGEALEGEQRTMACKMIADDKAALDAYVAKAKTDLAR